MTSRSTAAACDPPPESHSVPGATEAEIAPPDLVTTLAGRVSALESLALALESTIGETICSCSEVAPETIHSLQRIDFLRQSLRDVALMLETVAPRLDWREGQAMSLGDLRAKTDLAVTLASLHQESPSPSEEDHDIWF